MNTQELIATVFGLAVAAVVLCTPAACTANRHIQISAAIQAGADPIETKCAIEGDSSQSPVCIVAAARKEPRK